MKKFKFYVLNLKPMSLNSPNQGTGIDTSLFNMFKILECLVWEFEETAKPINYTTIESCAEERGLHGSRYIYAALKKARNLGYVRFIERKSGGTWKFYALTMKGIVAVAAFNLAFMYRVPELYTLIMDYMVAWVRISVETLKKWKEIMDREGINYNRNYIENVIRIGERILSAFREDVPSNPEELLETMKYVGANMNTVFRDWFNALVKELENAGVPKEGVRKVIMPTPEEVIEFFGPPSMYVKRVFKEELENG
jgi:DNA-binding PadR family transcriptional regulator